MPRLTLTFKEIPLQSVELESGEIGIGSNPSNALYIDSPAIAPFHATVQSTPVGYVIRQLEADFPIYLNNRQVSEELLSNGDHVLIGKHGLHFTDQPSDAKTNENRERKPPSYSQTFEGSFQVMNGKQIGMLIPLKNSVTRIGKEASGMVIVTKGEDNYVIAPGSDDLLLTINGRPVKEEAPLSDGDTVRINSSLLRFFQR
jgi:hypothetical protein